MDKIHHLRSLDFPASLMTALQYVETYTLQSNTNKKSTIPGLEGNNENWAQDIALEFIFHQKHQRGTYVKKPSAVQELQTLDLLCDYFIRNDPVRSMMVFGVLFSGDMSPVQMNMLSQLVSMGIAVKCKHLLNCVASWMEHHEFNSPSVLWLVKSLVQDYCLLVPGATSVLQDLSNISAKFSCNFITALTKIYSFEGSTSKCPPLNLIELVTDWVSKSKTLCLQSLVVDESLSGLSQNNARGLLELQQHSPILGLSKWCIMAPLFLDNQTSTESSKSDSSESKNITITLAKLHLGIIQTLIASEEQFYRDFLNAKEVMSIAENLSVKSKQSDQTESENETVQTAIERLAQVVQVAMAVGALSLRYEDDLLHMAQLFPSNRIFEIILSQYVTTVSQPMQQ